MGGGRRVGGYDQNRGVGLVKKRGGKKQRIENSK